MKTAKLSIFGTIVLLFAGGVACSQTAPTDLTPRIDTSQGAPRLILPPQLLVEMQHSFPGYRVPGDKERIREWAQSDKFPYVVWGDFDGNGLTDLVLILLSDERWALAVFHQQKGERYSSLSLLSIRLFPPAEDDQRIQARSLSVLKKNTETLKFPADAFVLTFIDRSMTFFHWSNGEYKKIVQGYE
jgi:hypothetical protein